MILPSWRFGAPFDGTLVKAPAKCLTCPLRLCGKTMCTTNCGVMKKCRWGHLYYRTRDGKACFVGLEKCGVNITSQQLEEVYALESTIASIPRIVAVAKKNSAQYDITLKMLRDVLKPVFKKADSVKRKGGWIDVDPVKLDIVKDIIQKLRALTNQTNVEVNRLSTKALVIPSLMRIMAAKDLSEIDDLENQNGVPIGRFDRNAFLGILKRIDEFKKKVKDFNQWVHDVNHFMVRLNNALPAHDQQQVAVDQIHSIDALTVVFMLLKEELMRCFGLMRGNRLSNWGGQASGYYPYNLFHKHRQCYFDEDIEWKRGREDFRRKAKPAVGVDYVAMNVYANAIKYLRKYPGPREVSTSFHTQTDGVEIVVSSFGPIVRNDDLPKVFDDGYRTKEAEATCAGSGRGLHRVKSVCDEAGYKVWCTSDAGASRYEGFGLFGVHIFIPNDKFFA